MIEGMQEVLIKLMKQLLNLFIIGVLFFNIQLVFADECTSDEIQSLKELSKVIDVSLEFDYEAASESGIFNQNIVSVFGITEGFYAITKNHSIGFYYDESFEGAVIKNMAKTMNAGSDILEIYSEKCPDTVLRTIQLNLKKYNLFSGYKECEEIDKKELDVCDPFYDKALTYEEFIKKINNYNHKKNKNDRDDIKSSVSSFIKKYIIIFIGIGVVFIGGIIFAIVKKIKSYKLN